MAEHKERKRKMEKIRDIFNNICVRAALLMGFLICLILTVWTGKYSYAYPLDYHPERLEEMPDALLPNLLALILAVVVMAVLQKILLRGSEEKKRRIVKYFALAESAVIGILLLAWVLYSNTVPYWDQSEVYQMSLEFMDGKFDNMARYMNLFPQQYGLSFIYEVIFSITFQNSYKVIECLNVLCIVLIVYFGYKLVDDCFRNAAAGFYYLIAILFFFPLHVYSTYVYGDVFSIAAGMISIWAVNRWLRNGKKRYVAVILLLLIPATLARKNTLIILLALAIVLLVHAVTVWKWQPLVLAAAIVLLPLGAMEAVLYSYEVRSGTEIGEGIPSIMWIAMGMQDSYNGKGVYTGYNNSVYLMEADGDSELCAELGKEYIRERRREFRRDIAYTKEFYRLKFLTQWADQTYSSLIGNAHFDGEPKDLVREVYYGNTRGFIEGFMERYIYVMYFTAAACLLYLLVKRPRTGVCLPCVALIGGVLFSLLWEAKGRYVLPYVVLIIPYASMGIYVIQRGAVQAAVSGREAVKSFIGRNCKETDEKED